MLLKCDGLYLLANEPVIAVFQPGTALGKYHAALAFYHFRVDREVADTVGFEFEDRFQGVFLEPVGVDGHVFGRVRIVGTAVGFHYPVELLRTVIFGAVEHHVFEEVGESGNAVYLVPRADLPEKVHVRRGDGMVFQDEEFHAVGERETFHILRPGLRMRDAEARERGRSE